MRWSELMSRWRGVRYTVVVRGDEGYRRLDRSVTFATWDEAVAWAAARLTTKEYYRIEKWRKGAWLWDSSTLRGGSRVVPLRRYCDKRGGCA